MQPKLHFLPPRTGFVGEAGGALSPALRSACSVALCTRMASPPRLARSAGADAARHLPQHNNGYPVPSSAACGFLDLPDEILALVLAYLRPGDHLAARLVCRRWRAILRHNQSVERTKTPIPLVVASTPMAEWAHSLGCPPAALCEAAVCTGSLQVLRRVHALSCPLDRRAAHGPACPATAITSSTTQFFRHRAK